MTTMTKATTVRLDEPEKTIAQELLSGMGLNLNAYLNMAVHQLAIQKEIPFKVLAAPNVAKDETYKAMIAAEAKVLGLIPDDARSFTDADTLIDFLESD
jgi:DNA-damage-inducible protein J